MTVIIRERSGLRDAWHWLLGGIPAGLVRLLQGDILQVQPADAAGVPRSRRVRLLLGPEHVLSRRLTLPLSAKSDLPGSIELLIETETPFSPDELLVHAERLVASGDASEASYQVRMVPRQALHKAMVLLGIRPSQIASIADVGAPMRTDFFRSAFPVRSRLRWLAAVPVAIMAGCIWLLLVQAQALREAKISSLNGAVAERLAQLRQVASDLDARRQDVEGNAEISSLLSASTSAFNVLELVRAGLASDVQILRLEFSGRTLLLSVRAVDALAVASQLESTMSAQIEGAITADLGTGLEQATIRISAKPGNA